MRLRCRVRSHLFTPFLGHRLLRSCGSGFEELQLKSRAASARDPAAFRVSRLAAFSRRLLLSRRLVASVLLLRSCVILAMNFHNVHLRLRTSVPCPPWCPLRSRRWPGCGTTCGWTGSHTCSRWRHRANETSHAGVEGIYAARRARQRFLYMRSCSGVLESDSLRCSQGRFVVILLGDLRPEVSHEGSGPIRSAAVGQPP